MGAERARARCELAFEPGERQEGPTQSPPMDAHMGVSHPPSRSPAMKPPARLLAFALAVGAASALTPSPTALGAEGAPNAAAVGRAELGKMARFLREKFVGKILRSETRSLSAAGKLEILTKGSRYVSGLTEGAQTISFDVTVHLVQDIHDLDAAGKRSGEPRHLDRISVVRYELGASESTGELIGLLTIESNSAYDTRNGGAAIRARMDGDRLVLESESILYGDYFGPGGTWIPGRSTGTSTFDVDGGKARIRDSSESWRIDPKTLERAEKLSQSTSEYLESAPT